MVRYFEENDVSYIALLSNITVSYADAKFARHPNFDQNEFFLTGHTNIPYIS